jgi:sortase A
MVAAVGLGLLTACTATESPVPPPATARPTSPSDTPATSSTSVATTTTSAPATSTTTRGPTPSDGRPVPARLSVPALKLSGLLVQPYEGWTDDGPGTAIQDRGVAASPYGPRGGTGPGGIGNYQVTAHRTSSTAAFRHLPDLAEGDVAHVDAEGVRYTYALTETRTTSFRSAASLAEQRAAVPGRPGVPPTSAMITLSTCLTPEDHAAGNFWSDRYKNPEHRVDKIGVLVETARAPA